MTVNAPWFSVEAFLRTLRGCEHSKIINVAGDNDSVRLVAAIPATVVQGEASDQAGAVKYCRNALKKRFATDPDNKGFIPQRWVVLEHFPLTSTGEVDAAAVEQELVKLGFATSGFSRIDKLRSIISHVLRLQYSKVTPTSSFLRLGGSSITAIEVMSRCLRHHMFFSVSTILRSESLIDLVANAEYAAASHKVSASNGNGVEPQLNAPAGASAKMAASHGSRTEAVFPCFAVQDGILVSQIRAADSYAITCVLQLTRPDTHASLSIAKLEEAWCTVVARHDALRTVFASSTGGESMFEQVILPSISPDITRLPDCQDDQTTLETLHALNAPIFGISTPGHVLTTCASGSGQVFCRLDMSHAIVDGMSAVIIFDDLGAAYRNALSASNDTTLQDYIVSRSNSPQAESLNYWLSYLDGFQPTSFPTLVEHRESPDSFATLPLDVESGSLKQFCKIHSVSVPVLMQAVWATVLCAYLQTDDVCFGYLGSGRDVPMAGINRIVGVLINLLVCRVRYEPTQGVFSLLKKLQSELTMALDNQNTSLAKIQHGLQLGDKPLFDTLLSVMYWGADETEDTTQVGVKVLSHTAKTEVRRSLDCLED
jgi:hypothetical protein